MLKSSLCDYKDAYMHVKETIIFPNARTVAVLYNRNKKAIGCISKIKNTQVGNAKDIDVMLIHNLKEYSDMYKLMVIL